MDHTITGNEIKKTTGQISENNWKVQNIIDEINSKNVPNDLSNVFIPRWDNKPPAVPPVLSLRGTPILTHQNSSAIIAKPGMGKTSIIEAIPADFINPNCDSVGFEVHSSCKGILIIDNERTNSDVWNTFSRMAKRGGVKQGDPINGVTIAGMRQISRLEERRKAVEQLIIDTACSLLLIDGAGDFVYDTNDLQQAIECRIWYRELTVKYNLSILSTLHPNPGSEKPRGHQGSEICREAECVLIVKEHENGSRCITSDFEHGKNRNNPKLTSAYKWSDEHKMFLYADYDEMLIGAESEKFEQKRQKIQSLTKQIFPPNKALSYTEIISLLIDGEYVNSKETAKRRLKEMIDHLLIKRGSDELYRLVV